MYVTVSIPAFVYVVGKDRVHKAIGYRMTIFKLGMCLSMPLSGTYSIFLVMKLLHGKVV